MNWASATVGGRLVGYSSQLPSCGAHHILDDDLSKIWLSDDGVPQWLCISLENVSSAEEVEVRSVGWHCWHAYSTNPREVRLHVSKDGAKFRVWDTFVADCKRGSQMFCCAPINAALYPFIALEIVSTFGGTQTYLNRVFLLSDEMGGSMLSSDSVSEADNSALDASIVRVENTRMNTLATTSTLEFQRALGISHASDESVNASFEDFRYRSFSQKSAHGDENDVAHSIQPCEWVEEETERGKDVHSPKTSEADLLSSNLMEQQLDNRLDRLEQRLLSIATLLSMRASQLTTSSHPDTAEVCTRVVASDTLCSSRTPARASWNSNALPMTSGRAPHMRSTTLSTPQARLPATNGARESSSDVLLRPEDISELVHELHSRIVLKTIREAQLNLVVKKRGVKQ